jgi:hypothetical protein
MSKISHVAIDPGASGGIVWQDIDGEMATLPMPAQSTDIVSLLNGLKMSGINTLVLEQLPRFVPMGGGKGIPGSMAAVMFENFGIILGAAIALGFKIVRVPPQEWQKGLGLGNSKDYGSKSQWKNKLKGRAQELFPKVKVTLKTSDALLIWEYWHRSP